jgi:hypothetical protein
MKSRMLLSALFKMTNLGILLVSMGIAYIISGLISAAAVFAWPAAAVVYLVSVAVTLSSNKFHDEFNQKQKVRKIQDLNYACLRLSNEAKKQANAAYNLKLKNVMEDKEDIVNSFFNGEKSYLKEKIVEQTLNLVVAYIKLFTNFCMRKRELSEFDYAEAVGRINANSRKLPFIEGTPAADDIRKSIEMDEKTLAQAKEEAGNLERISAKLDYMESTVNMFKQQIISSIESEEMLETLQTAVNEAEALDNVLQERRRTKINI